MTTYKERKEQRVAWYWAWRHGWRQRPCGACSGSGRYDNNGRPRCGACEGTGKETYPGPKSPKYKGEYKGES